MTFICSNLGEPLKRNVGFLVEGVWMRYFIGVALASFLTLSYQAKPGKVLNATEVPTVDYCELLSNPSPYYQTVMRLKVLYVRGFELAAFEDPQCDEERSVWVEFDQSEASCTDKKVQKEMKKIFSPPSQKKRGVMEIGGSTRAELLVVGRFEGPKPGIPIGTEGRKILTGHGHMSQYKYKFVVQCVEQVKPVPFP